MLDSRGAFRMDSTALTTAFLTPTWKKSSKSSSWSLDHPLDLSSKAACRFKLAGERSSRCCKRISYSARAAIISEFKSLLASSDVSKFSSALRRKSSRRCTSCIYWVEGSVGPCVSIMSFRIPSFKCLRRFLRTFRRKTCSAVRNSLSVISELGEDRSPGGA